MLKTSSPASCPHTGLPITTHESWLNIQTGKDYKMSFGIIGNKILLSKPSGNLSTANIIKANAARAKILQEYFHNPNPEIIEIRDYSEVHGSPSHEYRALFREALKSQKQYRGFIICNAGWVLRILFQAGLRLHKLHYPVQICDDYKQAIKVANSLLTGFVCPIPTSKHEWQTRTDNIQVTHRILEHNIIYTKAAGQLIARDVPNVLNNFEKVLKEDSIVDKEFYRVADYSKIKDTAWRARYLLTHGQQQLHANHGKLPIAMVVFGLSPVMVTALRLASKFIGYQVFFEENEEQAFDHVHSLINPTPKQPAQGTMMPEVEKTLRFISTMIVGSPEEDNQPEILAPPDNGPDPVLEALKLAKLDINELLKDARQRTEEITEKNRKLEAEIQRRQQAEELQLIAMEEAKIANQAKDNFLATVSHEIRTPMNGIIGMIHLLQQTKLSAEQQKYLDISQKSSQSLLLLINDILDFSKIEQGRSLTENINFDLSELLENCSMLFANDIQEKALNLDCQIDPNLTNHLIGDPEKLRQILTNLVSNAIKFTTKGSITTQTKILKKTHDHITIAFTIRDTGIGIEKTKLKTIFEVFTQADSSITRKYGGTGLGLAISQKICQTLGGDIQVESTIGKGTTFSFTLQYGLGRPLTKKTAIPEPGPTQKKIKPQRHLKILVVEDEPINQLFVESLLDSLGYGFDHAENGLLAVEAMENQEYDLILMDCQMPVMDGYEATRKIREIFSTKPEPIIIALTAHAMSGDRKKCLECGMDDYISKPIDPDVLQSTLEKHLYREEQ